MKSITTWIGIAIIITGLIMAIKGDTADGIIIVSIGGGFIFTKDGQIFKRI